MSSKALGPHMWRCDLSREVVGAGIAVLEANGNSLFEESAATNSICMPQRG